MCGSHIRSSQAFTCMCRGGTRNRRECKKEGRWEKRRKIVVGIDHVKEQPLCCAKWKVRFWDFSVQMLLKNCTRHLPASFNN